MADVTNVQSAGQTTEVPATADSTPVATQATETATPVQTDLQKTEAAITALKTAGEALFTDEIAALEAKRDALIAEVEAEIKAAETDVKEAGAKFITAEQTFAQKYGQAIAHVIEIALLAYIAGRLAGVI